MPLTLLQVSSTINILYPNSTFGIIDEPSLASQSPQAHSLHFGFCFHIYSTDVTNV